MLLRRLLDRAASAPDGAALIFNDRPLSNRAFVGAIETIRHGLTAARAPERGVAVVLVAHALATWLMVIAARAHGLTTVVAASAADAASLNLRDVSCILFSADSEPPSAYPQARRIAFAPALLDARAAPSRPPLPLGPWGDHILYSSGTTGTYKKILVDGRVEDARALDRVRISGWGPDTVFHAINFALWTGIGMKSPTAVWTAGGTVIIDQSPEAPARFLRHDPTHAQTTPEVLRPIVEAHAGHRPSERLALRCGGGFVPLELARLALERVATRFMVGFSSTEISAAIMLQPFREADDLMWLSPDPQRVIQVVDDEGREVPPLTEGSLRVALSDIDSQAYLDDPEATARSFREGFFYPGDLAMRREDGRIRILGRSADVINVNGRKIAVGPIEATLQRALGVEEVCLFGGMGSDGVEEVVVAVQTPLPMSPDEVLRRLGPSELFGRVRVVVLGAFPRTVMGLAKTNRTALRRLVFAGA